jgi:hypothetical protein
MKNAYTVFWLQSLKGRDHSEDLGVDGRIILEWILREIRWEAVDWMHLAQDRVQWRDLVNTVMKFPVP